jgi:ribulose 1,5-bisphosphate carboxylase large subunit-like protein
MTALIWLFLKNNWLSLLVVAAVLAIVGVVYIKGHSDGTAAGAAAQTKAIINQLKERNITDEKVQSMSDPELCRAIGGVWSDDRCQ